MVITSKMALSFLFLAAGLLLPIADCRTGSRIKLKAIDYQSCGEKFLPGIEVMIKGYDITSYTAYGPEPGNIKEDIFDYTCKKNASFLINKDKFSVPDQFLTVAPVNTKKWDEKITFLDHFEQIVNSQSTGIKTDDMKDYFEKLGKGAGAVALLAGKPELKPEMEAIGNAVGAMSQALPAIHKSSLEEFSSLMQKTELRVNYHFTMELHIVNFENPEYLVPGKNFIKSYMALPKSFKDDPEPFKSFLGRFGTHYMNKVSFGGRANYRGTYTDSNLATSRKKAIQNDFHIFFVSTTKSSSESTSNEDRRVEKNIDAKVVGGDLSVLVKPYRGTIGAWEKSVYEKPAPIKISFVPIAHLIANQNISYQVAQAILWKVNNDAFEQYQDLLQIIHPDRLSQPILARERIAKDLGKWKVPDSYEDAKRPIREYKQMYKENAKLFQNKPSDVDMLTKMTNDVYVRNHGIQYLASFYHNLIAYMKFQTVMDEAFVYDSVWKCLNSIYAGDTKKWFSKSTGPKNFDFYRKVYATAKSLFTDFHDRRFYANSRFLSEFPEATFDLEKKIEHFRNNVKTGSCEDASSTRNCYWYTTYKVWKDTECWNRLPKEMFHQVLAESLTPMQHKDWQWYINKQVGYKFKWYEQYG